MIKEMRLLFLMLPFFLSAQEWQVLEDEDAIKISIDGNIVAGDKHTIYFFPAEEEGCEVAHSYFSSYSMADRAVAEMKNLPSKYVLANINDKEKFLATAVTASEFLLGTLVYFYATSNAAEDLLEFYAEDDLISIELMDFYDTETNKRLNVNIEDYFDLPKNTWNLAGLAEALELGKEKCLASDYAQ
jgi:hypothetical protein